MFAIGKEISLERQGSSLDEIAIMYSYITNVLSILASPQIAAPAKNKLYQSEGCS